MLLKKLALGFIFISALSHCSGMATGGSSTVIGNPDTPPVNTGTEGSLFGAGPIDIPAPIAKLESPNPAYITVGIGGAQNISSLRNLNAGEQICITGNAGAIPDPVTTPFVYIYDSLNATAEVVAVAGDGSWVQTCFSSEGPFAVASSVDELASQISAPIFLKIDENTYLWLLTNGDTISSGAVTFVDNTVYLVATSSTSASLSALKKLNKMATTSSSTVYSLGIAGTYDEVGTCDCAIKEIQVANGGTIVRDDEGTFFKLSDTTFEEIFALDGSEEFEFMRLYDDENFESDNNNLAPGATAAHLYLAIITNNHLYMIDMDEEDSDVVYDLAADEKIVSWSWGRGIQVVLNLLDKNTQTYIQISLNGFENESVSNDYNPDWSTVWDNKIIVSEDGDGSYFYRIEQSGDDFVSIGKEQFSVGQTINLNYLPSNSTLISDADPVPDCAGEITGEPVTFFDTWNSRGTGCLNGNSLCYPEGNAQITAQLCDQNDDGTGDIYEITAIDTTQIMYEAVPHPSLEFIYYCALDESGLGQIYAYFPDDDDVIALTEGVEHCNEDNNWRIDSETGYLVFTNATSDLESSQVDFIDAYTDPRLLGTD